MLRHASDFDRRILDEQRSAQMRVLGRLPAGQQPGWHDSADLAQVRAELAELPALVDRRQILALRQLLSRVELGTAFVLHVGECAETFAMATPEHVTRRVGLYRRLADHLAARTGQPVVLVTRMAGQHAKPRSEAEEVLPDGTSIPTYRGDAVNGLVESSDARRADPRRLLASYGRARDTLAYLQGQLHLGHPIFVSHEALIREYEEAMTRRDGDDALPDEYGSIAHYFWAQLYAVSGHLVWIGERTRQLGNWHVQWAMAIGNPIGLKIGATASGRDLVGLIRALNPRCEPGRLTVIPRLGAGDGGRQLAALTRATVESRSPVLWQCDPMHGNTRKLDRTKLRLLPDIRAEVSAFVRTLRAARCHPGGLHLEVTPEDVQECHEILPAGADHRPRPPCDPRLNPDQAMEIVDHFANEVTR